jgi:hypothetical protein
MQMIENPSLVLLCIVEQKMEKIKSCMNITDLMLKGIMEI